MSVRHRMYEGQKRESIVRWKPLPEGTAKASPVSVADTMATTVDDDLPF